MSEQVEAPYASSLLDVVHAAHVANQPKPHAFDTPFRHSDGGDCARRLGMKAMGIEATEEFDVASEWVTWLGTKLHEEWQESQQLVDDEDRIPEVGAHDPQMLSSGSLDLLHSRPGQRVTVEAKFVNARKFENAVGIINRGSHSKRKQPKGPSAGHVIQLALNTVASDSDYGVLFYFATSALSKFVQNSINRYYPDDPLTDKGRVLVEWTYTRAQLEPIARDELQRLAKIKSEIDNGVIPVPVAIGDNFKEETVNPFGEDDYHCLYCDRRTACLELYAAEPTTDRSEG